MIKRIMLLVFVLLTYVVSVYPSLNTWDKSGSKPQENYQYLSAGFLAGQLSLSVQRPAGPYRKNYLKNLISQQEFFLHDASLYHGKYYLYFGPLPALTYFIPIKLLSGIYPPESLGIVMYLWLGFIAGFLLLIQIKEKYFPALSENKLLFSGLLLGLTNNAMFLLIRPKFYEMAISAAFCMVSVALLCLFKSLDGNFRQRDFCGFSLCLGLSVAARVSYAALCFILIPVVGIYILKKAPRQKIPALLISLCLPAFMIGVTLGLYNYLRFGSFFDAGMLYQLGTNNSVEFLKPKFLNWHAGLMYYLFEAPRLSYQFPFIHASHFSLASKVKSYNEASVGIFFTTPFALFALALPGFLLQKKYWRHLQMALFIALLTSVFLVSFFMLISLNFRCRRYFSDFSPSLVILSILTYWLIDQSRLHKAVVEFANIFFIEMGFISLFCWISIGCKNYANIFSVYSHYLIFVGSRSVDINLSLILLVLLLTGLYKLIFRSAMI